MRVLTVRRTMRLGGICCALVAAVLILAACGSSKSSSSSSAAPATTSSSTSTSTSATASPEVEEVVKAAEAPAKWKGPSSSPKPAAGKHIFILETIEAAEGAHRQALGTEAAAKAMGWTFTKFDGEGKATRYASGLEQAISEKVSGIVLGSITPVLVKTQLAKVRAAGIPVVDISDTEPPSPTTINANIGYNTPNEGKAQAAFVTRESEGKAQVAVFTDVEYGIVVERDDTFKSNLSKFCSGCKIANETAITSAELGTPALVAKMKAVLLANPNVNWVLPPYDNAADAAIQAVGEAGLASKVKVAGWDGNKQNLEFVREGKQQDDIGTPAEWFGWEAVDVLHRIFNNQSYNALDEKSEPLRMFTKNNIAELPKGQAFAGTEANFEAEYKKLWGTG
jgi:ribose transport system substrate-binding protein